MYRICTHQDKAKDRFAVKDTGSGTAMFEPDDAMAGESPKRVGPDSTLAPIDTRQLTTSS